MCPSTSRGTWPGSQLGIWPAIAVTIPDAKEAHARSARIRSTRRSRSLRILCRRPFAASSVRLRRNKRRILALSGGGIDLYEGLVRGLRGATVLFLSDHDRAAARNRPVQGDRRQVASGGE